MPSFTVHTAKTLSDYIVPLQESDAETILSMALANAGEQVYAAAYGEDIFGGRGWIALYVTCEAITPEGKAYYIVGTDEYHPRKYGKAMIEFGRPARKRSAR